MDHLFLILPRYSAHPLTFFHRRFQAGEPIIPQQGPLPRITFPDRLTYLSISCMQVRQPP